jgi:hypothetical protein
MPPPSIQILRATTIKITGPIRTGIKQGGNSGGRFAAKGRKERKEIFVCCRQGFGANQCYYRNEIFVKEGR